MTIFSRSFKRLFLYYCTYRYSLCNCAALFLFTRKNPDNKQSKRLMKNTLTIIKRNSLKCPNLSRFVQTVKQDYYSLFFVFLKKRPWRPWPGARKAATLLNPREPSQEGTKRRCSLLCCCSVCDGCKVCFTISSTPSIITSTL